ncbi:hypothetical protein TraAM80_08912 [Trypanosoma rangeli]|uniref:Uncharacterized protein n=1 Tax=Trypanosoma rangeli TaxID=5698 RepID=A0A422MYF0_TRYRA|nr:uncharacterized protein TraAM80_08912 [Trypanosoma rangeli]RNE98200.1 hypothetical protein TraAM80_08912 [Trypanosoma rangeli]|eukprot:RNE98200.1 hypothetical protein TraAM80_08912 [Trypanosoma rangeli]
MALTLADGVEKEARRIIASENAFDALALNPVDAKGEVVLRRYEEKVAPLRRLVRNRLAMEAKARLDHAKIVLLDDVLRAKELLRFNSQQRSAVQEREELKALEARTKMLEARAAALSA